MSTSFPVFALVCSARCHEVKLGGHLTSANISLGRNHVQAMCLLPESVQHGPKHQTGREAGFVGRRFLYPVPRKT